MSTEMNSAEVLTDEYFDAGKRGRRVSGGPLFIQEPLRASARINVVEPRQSKETGAISQFFLNLNQAIVLADTIRA